MRAGIAGRLAGSARIARLLAKLLSAGAAAQFLGVLTGLALLRWLPVEDYAQYTVAYGFSATLTALVDVGLAGAIMPLVGERAPDRSVLAAYVRAALHLRGRLAAAAVPISAVAFFAITASRDWGIGVQLGLFATVVVTLLARAMVDIYELPLLMQGRYRDYYAAQIGVAGSRLTVSAGLYGFRGLTGVTASLVSAGAALVQGLAYRRVARACVDVPEHVDREKTREILRFVAPALPGVVFFALQGQITIFLIAVFGEVRSIAEVGALSRLTALFVVVAGMSQVLVAPRFPQLARERLFFETSRVLVAAFGFGAVLTTMAFVFPEPFLLLLGPSYDGLRSEVAWFILAASVNALSAVAYAINFSRRFVWYWTTWVGLGLIVSSQIAGAFLFDLSSTLGLQYFAALAALGACLGQAVTFVHGVRTGPARGVV